ncbi:MAG: hypothetical protein ACERKO_06960, partial [Acetanaerobacterium sp.]
MRNLKLLSILLGVTLSLSACATVQSTSLHDTPSVPPVSSEDISSTRSSMVQSGEDPLSSETQPALDSSDHPLQVIENPSDFAPMPEEIPTDDEQMIPIYKFFYRYYNTFVTLETQDFSDIMLDNDNTQIMREMLRYMAARGRIEKALISDFSFTLDEIKQTSSAEKTTVKLRCLQHFHYAGSDTLSGEGLRFTVELTQTQNGWRISYVVVDENGPDFYDGFCNLIESFKEPDMDLWEFTNERIRYA